MHNALDASKEFASDRSSTYHPSRSWRPKLTLYRAWVLSTMIGLGSGKAYATSQDTALASANVEWIAAVVLFSVFFILGLLEPNPPRSLSYIFDHDLMSTQHHYFAYEKKPPASANEGILLTGYRLLMTVSVTSFGLVKAFTAYGGTPEASNAVDWISGMLLMASLYVLGLYEDNPVGLMPYLFLFDYSRPVITGSLVTLYLSGLLLCSTWTIYWVKRLFLPFPDIRAIYNGTDHANSIHAAPTTTPQSIHNLSQFAFQTFTSLLVPSIGLLFFVITFIKLIEMINGIGWVKTTYEVIQRTKAFRVARTICLVSWVKRPLCLARKVLRFIRRFALHIIVYTFGTLMAGIMAFNIVGVVSVLCSQVEANSPSQYTTYFVAVYFMLIGGIPFSLAGYMCWCSLMMLVAPFQVDWEASGYQRTLLEL